MRMSPSAWTVLSMIAHETKGSEMDDVQTPKKKAVAQEHREHHTTSNSQWISVPEPIRRVFNVFPVVKYARNQLPQRAPRSRHEHTLYIFATDSSPSRANLSCNPACLKWQAYLIFNNIEFHVLPSNNHASPSGALPFLIPSSSNRFDVSNPIASNKIAKWVSAQGTQEHIPSMRQEAYSALVEQNIRDAWLYHLYLSNGNFEAVARPLYIESCSSNQFVHMALAYQLKTAAQQELLKGRQIIDKDDLYEAAGKAFRSLSTLLGDDLYFFGAQDPQLFDASVFAYTHLLLDTNLKWKDQTLQDMLQLYPNLVYHRNRILDNITKA